MEGDRASSPWDLAASGSGARNPLPAGRSSGGVPGERSPLGLRGDLVPRSLVGA